MRIRSEVTGDLPVATNLTTVKRTGTCSNPSGTEVTTNTYGTCNGKTFSRTMHDVVTPNFKKKVAQGIIINSPMFYEEIEEESACYSYRNYFSTSFWNAGCNPDKWVDTSSDTYGTQDSLATLVAKGFGYIDPPGVDETRLTALAITEAWANIEQSEIGILEVLAEFKRTIVDLTSLVKKGITIGSIIKKGGNYSLERAYREGKTAKYIADSYMELRYLIRPFLYDCRDLYHTLTKQRDIIGTRKTFRGWEAQVERSSDQKQQVITTGVGTGQRIQTVTAVRSSFTDLQVRTGVLTKVVSNHWLDRWGFDNSLEAMWELTRLSFVIDWVFNVGKTIASLTPEAGLKPLASWVFVERQEFQISQIVEATQIFTGAPNYRLNGSELTYSGCKAYKNRIVRSRLPNPPRDILPTFQLKLDVWKLADLLVILSQFLR